MAAFAYKLSFRAKQIADSDRQKSANNSRSRCRRRTLRGYSKRPLDMYGWLAGTAPLPSFTGVGTHAPSHAVSLDLSRISPS